MQHRNAFLYITTCYTTTTLACTEKFYFASKHNICGACKIRNHGKTFLCMKTTLGCSVKFQKTYIFVVHARDHTVGKFFCAWKLHLGALKKIYFASKHILVVPEHWKFFLCMKTTLGCTEKFYFASSLRETTWTDMHSTYTSGLRGPMYNAHTGRLWEDTGGQPTHKLPEFHLGISP